MSGVRIERRGVAWRSTLSTCGRGGRDDDVEIRPVRRVGLASAGYELVAKSGKIDYKKPVTSDFIVARSVLPSDEELSRFRAALEESGKAFCTISGSVAVEERTHVVYEIEVCAFRPRAK